MKITVNQLAELIPGLRIRIVREQEDLPGVLDAPGLTVCQAHRIINTYFNQHEIDQVARGLEKVGPFPMLVAHNLWRDDGRFDWVLFSLKPECLFEVVRHVVLCEGGIERMEPDMELTYGKIQ